MQDDIKKLIGEMSLIEKAAICSGIDSWNTTPVARLSIPSVMMTDGPHGVRKETDEEDDGILIKKSHPATCYPTAAALACSWDIELMHQLGEALGEESLAAGVSILLGPGVNIKRSPLCGRNFEYYSEDPLLAGELASAFIEGVQSKGVGTSLKHFAVNNQETARMTVDTVMDERTLREIYLANFEIAVKKAKPWTVMCSYNKLLGTYCSESKKLLTDILRKEWGFDGLVVSDWGAVNERDDGIAAGLDLEMPTGGPDSENKIIAAVKSGKLPESILDATVERILQTVLKSEKNKRENAACDLQKKHELARRIAGECMVLLKNNGVLPLPRTGKIAVVGAFAKNPRIQGGGSSHINPAMIASPLEEIRKTAGRDAAICWCAGYPLDESDERIGSGFNNALNTPDEALIREAVDAALEADITVLFAGLPDSFESEGYDRTHMRLPESQLKLIDAVAGAAEKVVIVLMNGSPVEMPWLEKVDGILEGYLGGQAAGGAIADLLFGDVNPSGKLAETFPARLSDNPSYLNFPGFGNKVEYGEGVFVGYRYYEKKQIKPRFPFGYGLSYTAFSYTNIQISSADIRENETVTVQISLKNTGTRAGKETVQLYVRDDISSILRPEKELKGFAKVYLEAGEEKTVSFSLDKRAFAYYDESVRDWRVETGTFTILAGGCSAETPLCTSLTVRAAAADKIFYTRNSTIEEVLANPAGAQILREMAGEEMIASLAPFVLQMPLRSIHMQMPEVTEEVIANLTAFLNS